MFASSIVNAIKIVSHLSQLFYSQPLIFFNSPNTISSHHNLWPMKNTLLLDNHYYPQELKTQISTFVEYYNHQRYRESLKNVTPADFYQGRAALILERQ